MNICETSTCNRPAETTKVINAPFSMTSTSGNSKRSINICGVCAEQEVRLSTVRKKATLK